MAQEGKKLGRVVFFAPVGKIYRCIGFSKVLPYFQALNVYANTPNPASQLVGGDTEEEVTKASRDMIEKMADADYVEEYVEPYI